jgi:hypothetical protein
MALAGKLLRKTWGAGHVGNLGFQLNFRSFHMLLLNNNMFLLKRFIRFCSMPHIHDSA